MNKSDWFFTIIITTFVVGCFSLFSYFVYENEKEAKIEAELRNKSVAFQTCKIEGYKDDICYAKFRLEQIENME